MKINKEFLKKHWVMIVLGLILIFGFGLRIYYHTETIDQALWWDEADYMVLAKHIGTDTLDEYAQWKDIWSPRRPFLVPILGGIIFKLGLGEPGIKFMEILFSLAAVLLTYLFGKELFNKKVGLIAAFCMAVFWQQLFFSSRVLVGLPGSTFALAGIYCFWKGYMKKLKPKLIYLSALFFGLSLFTRHSTILFAVPIIALVIMKEKWKFIKNKHLWIGLLIVFLILTPNLIYLLINYDNPFAAGTGVGQERFASINPGTLPAILNYFKFFSVYLGWVFLFVFLVGCLKFANVILGYDMIFKNRHIQKYVMMFFWIITYILFFGYQGGYVGEVMPLQPRYLLPIFPAVFMILGSGMIKIYDLAKRYNKVFALVVVLVLLFFGAYYEIDHSKGVILVKKESYMPVKLAGLWIRDNSAPDAVVATTSVPQMRYYSERRADYINNDENYEKYAEKYNLKYWMVSVFERSGDWFNSFPEKHNLKPVQVYFADPQRTQPILIIYEFPEK